MAKVLTFTLVGIFTVCTAGTASAPRAVAEPLVPSQYRGAWCTTTWQTIYRRCPEASTGWAFTISRDGTYVDDESCKVTALRKSSHGEHRVWLECEKTDPAPSDSPTVGVERWRLGTNGTRLQILETSR
jgi:hypothetical protein